MPRQSYAFTHSDSCQSTAASKTKSSAKYFKSNVYSSFLALILFLRISHMVSKSERYFPTHAKGPNLAIKLGNYEKFR